MGEGVVVIITSSVYSDKDYSVVTIHMRLLGNYNYSYCSQQLTFLEHYVPVLLLNTVHGLSISLLILIITLWGKYWFPHLHVKKLRLGDVT